MALTVGDDRQMTSTALSAWAPPQRRNQVAGAILIVAVCAFWALLVPFINQQVEGANPFKAGQAHDLGGATIVPAEGWHLKGGSADSLFTTIAKGGATIILTPPVAADAPIEAALQIAIDGLKADTTTQWQVSAIQPIVTDAGVTGGRVVGVSADQAAVTYVLSDGTTSLTMLVTGDAASWKSLEPEVDAMVRSIVFTGVPGSSPSVAP
jgi:hypothetical protein